jgi:hypothetical protein
MRLGIVTDVHLGPVEYKDGRPVKLTGYAEPLTRQVVQRWVQQHRPDVALNLGDVLQDESRPADLENYRLFCSLLDDARVPVLHVAGNHDQVHLSDADLLGFWRLEERWPGALLHPGSTAYSADVGGYRFVVLSTLWAPPRGVFLGEGQLAFLDERLASAQGPCIVLTHQSASEMSLAGNHWFQAEPHMCLIHERAEIRRIIERRGNVAAVFNGHAHWNHVDVIAGVPYITLQSLTENITPGAEPTPAATSAIAEVTPAGLDLLVEGGQPLRFSLRV